MNRSEIAAYEALAAAVLMQAIADLSVKAEKDRALRFLTDRTLAPQRRIWLSWLGMNDAGFQKLIRQRIFQGQKNKLGISS